MSKFFFVKTQLTDSLFLPHGKSDSYEGYKILFHCVLTKKYQGMCCLLAVALVYGKKSIWWLWLQANNTSFSCVSAKINEKGTLERISVELISIPFISLGCPPMLFTTGNFLCTPQPAAELKEESLKDEVHHHGVSSPQLDTHRTLLIYRFVAMI